MSAKKVVKAFIAGLALPAVVLPIAYTIIYYNVRNAAGVKALQFIPMYLPLAWGVANVLYATFQTEGSSKKVNKGLIITGLILGFLVACFAVFVIRIPTLVFGQATTLEYAPLIVVPVIYALLWRYIVKWLNKTIGV